MSRKEHPVWEDELMPYMDGQLDAAQAAGIAEHLEKCEDCAASVAESKRLSQQLTGWRIEDAPQQLNRNVMAALQSQKPGKQHRERWSWWTKRRVWAFGLSGAFAGLVVIVLVSTSIRNEQEFLRSMRIQPYRSSPAVAPPPAGAPPAPMRLEQDEIAAAAKMQKQQVTSPDAPLGPMLIRSARLNIVARDFEGARSKLEAIVRQSQGYLDQMTVKGEAGSSRVLTANLRMPSDRMDNVLGDLRKLGKVQEESQNSSDITSQYVDLGARLTNARNTESRFQTILKERTGKLSDVVDVEREISRIREEIERMEAQQKEMSNQVQFASIQIEMSEEYHAQLDQSVPSAATSLWNASVDGYHTAEESLLGLALFILHFGPVLILWAVLLLPIALFLRRIRRVRFFQS